MKNLEFKCPPENGKPSPEQVPVPAEKKAQSYMVAPNVSSIFSDQVVLRRNHGNSTITLSFLHQAGSGEMIVEQARLVLLVDHAARLRDALARVLAPAENKETPA